MTLSMFRTLTLGVCIAQAHATYTQFGIPASSSVVDVRVFNVANLTGVGELHTFVHPILPGHEDISAPAYAFIIEHSANTAKTPRRVMFDLGIRKDPLNFAPGPASLFASGVFSSSADTDITDLLEGGGIALDSIESVIWSHAHFDHIGDMSKFPNSTSLVIGSETDTSTYPENANASLQTSDFAGHNVTKIDFAKANLTFSGMQAVDYFGDGSFYLLNSPGHIAGHLAALARVTPTSFVVLGGDTFHYAGQARPRPAFQAAFPCPAHILEEAQSPAGVSTDFFWSHDSHDGMFDLHSRSEQLLAVSDTPDSFYANPVAAQVSLEKISTFDADPDFFVIIAHDVSVLGSIPFFPESLSGWKASGLKEATVWKFLEPTNPGFLFAPRNVTV